MGRKRASTHYDPASSAHTGVQRFVLACVVALSVCAAASPSASASAEPATQARALQPEEAKSHVVSLDDSSMLQIGSYFPAFFTELWIDSRDLGKGTEVNLEAELRRQRGLLP